MDRSALKANYHKCAFSVWGRRVTPAVFGPQVYPGPIVCVLKDGLLSMTNGPPLLVCHWMGYTVICDKGCHPSFAQRVLASHKAIYLVEWIYFPATPVSVFAPPFALGG